MGSKVVMVGKRNIEVKQITVGGVIDIFGQDITTRNILPKCLSKRDMEYLDTLEFEVADGLINQITELLGAVVDVNDTIFPKPKKEITEEDKKK